MIEEKIPENDIVEKYGSYDPGADWEDIILGGMDTDLVSSLSEKELATEMYKRIATEVMGPGHVEAFVWHDRKDITRCGAAFGRYVYQPLASHDPGADPLDAGNHHARALYYHDVIEDGIDEVVDEYGLPPFEETVWLAERDRKRSLIEHDLWGEEFVYGHFEDVANALNLNGRWPRESETELHSLPVDVDSVFELNEWACHMTEFYACHTEKNETETPAYDETYLESKFRYHAWEAQKILFSYFTGRERDDPLVRQLSKEFLEAIRSHDAHRAEEQKANVDRMSCVHNAVLEERVNMEDSENLVLETRPLENRFRNSLNTLSREHL